MKLDFDAEVVKLREIGEEWIDGSGRPSIYVVIRRALKKIKTTPEMRLAIYMKYNYGLKFEGEDNASWIRDAKNMVKILGGK